MSERSRERAAPVDTGPRTEQPELTGGFGIPWTLPPGDSPAPDEADSADGPAGGDDGDREDEDGQWPQISTPRGEPADAATITAEPVPGDGGSDPCEAGDAPAEAQEGSRTLGLSRGDQLVIGVLGLAALVLMIGHWAWLSGWGMQPVEVDRLERQSEGSYRFDINRATEIELRQLKGIGETLAHRIVADRRENGPYESLDDLQRVPGIGPKTVERLRRWTEAEPSGSR